MASRTTLTIFFGFYALFYCLDLLEATAKTRTTQGDLPRLAAATLVPAVLATLALTPTLLYAHVRALGRANAGDGGAGARFVARLAKATLLAAVVTLLSGAAVQLGGDEVLRLGGADDVGWLNEK